MEWSWLVPVMICLSVGGSYVATTWIRAKHGYPIEDENGKTIHKTGTLEDSRKLELLEAENGKLRDQVLRLEERISVLERIVTDPAERTAREIDALR